MVKVIHIENGLGNQMACYAVYEAVKYAHPNDDIYIDTYIYDIKEANEVVSMWNGYELEKVFNVKLIDIRSLFNEKEIASQIEYLKKSRFWETGWNYDEVFVSMMRMYGLDLKIAYGNVGEDLEKDLSLHSRIRSIFRKYGSNAADSKMGYEIKRMIHIVNNKMSKDCGSYLIQRRDGNYFYNITLDFMKSPLLHQLIGEKVRDGLQFKEPTDRRNKECLEEVRLNNSVSMHVRRTDYLKFNQDCYRFGYFAKCTKYIRSHVENPVFYVFSDDINWCMHNCGEIGLKDTDRVRFIDINSGDKSYMDMQLMANCRHNIATKSSFGWWASFLNNNPNKITCCQTGAYVCTNQF